MIERSRMLLTALIALAVATASGCGTTGTGKAKPKIVAAKLPDAQPEARRHFEEGMRLIGLGPRHYEKAREALEKAVDIDAKVFEGWHNLGFLDARQGRWSESVANYQRALDIQPGSRATMLGLAEALQRVGRYPRAQGLLAKWMEAYPEDLELRLLYVASLRDGGKPRAALEEILKVLARDSNRAEAFNALGLVHRRLAHPALAETAFRRAAELDPKAAYVWNNLGLLALDRGDDQEAFRHFSKATEIDGRYIEALINKAVVYMDCGAYDLASAELEKALNVDGKDPDLHVALGVAARGSGKFGKAVSHYERALELHPDYPPALYNLGVLFMDHQENRRRARESFLLFQKVAGSDDPKRKDVKTRLTILKDMGT